MEVSQLSGVQMQVKARYLIGFANNALQSLRMSQGRRGM